MSDAKFDFQDHQYEKPYHHTVNVTRGDEALFETMDWGLEYYGYVDFILEKLNTLTFDSLAEVGCGDGKIIYELAKRYPKVSFEGYDLSQRSIAFAKAYGFDLHNLTFFDKDFAESTNRYDVIVTVETLEHVSDDLVPHFVQSLSDKLNDNGTVLICVPSTNLKLSSKHHRHYTTEKLTSEVGKLFAITEHWYVHNERKSGYWLNRFLIHNRFWITKYKPLRAWLFKQYRKHFQIGDNSNGAHLVALLHKKKAD